MPQHDLLRNCTTGVATALLALSLSACRSSGAAQTPASPAPGEDPMERTEPDRTADLPPQGEGFTTIVSGDRCGVPHALFARIDGQERWEELWRTHANRSIPRPATPAVDFEREVVLALVLGQRPSAGYRLEVTSVREEGGTLVVEAREVEPLADALHAAVVSTPFHFVRVPRTEGGIEFRVH